LVGNGARVPDQHIFWNEHISKESGPFRLVHDANWL
jgi:hypothetical protein